MKRGWDSTVPCLGFNNSTGWAILSHSSDPAGQLSTFFLSLRSMSHVEITGGDCILRNFHLLQNRLQLTSLRSCSRSAPWPILIRTELDLKTGKVWQQHYWKLRFSFMATSVHYSGRGKAAWRVAYILAGQEAESKTESSKSRRTPMFPDTCFFLLDSNT